MAEINIVEASIDDLQSALSSGSLTSVDLVARYLRRISTYDCRNVALNAIPILNNSIFEEAAASDDRRASGAHPRPLEGIPYTIKDSFKVKGMAAAAGSPAFKDLIANEDAFLVKTIRDAGGILVGRTNMPAVACGGMQRGIWGRAENPYNPEYLAAAFASGSSNGSAASTAASLAAFGIGAETVSSGRSPASNNALIAYTPSRGWLSIRGNWPLYPTCDVPVPHTRTMMDMLTLLDVIAVEDPVKEGEFWKEQPFVPQPKAWDKKPTSFRDLSVSRSLSGVRIAVPKMFLGQVAPKGARQVDTSPAVIELWEQARKHLESLGAEIVLVPHFPALTAYENDDLLPEGCPRRPQEWNAMERGALIAHAWNDFLKGFDDAKLPDLSAVDPFNIYPDSLRTEPELRHFERANAIQYHKLTEYLKTTKSLYEVEGLEEAVKALEGMRKILLEDWLVVLDCHCVAFPAAGDVGPANADSSFEGAALAWRNGVYYSNGNRAIRHLGIPTVSVPMGLLRDKGVPMSLTFAGKAFDDVSLLRWANAFESKTNNRVPPSHTPALDSDLIAVSSTPSPPTPTRRPGLTIETFKASPVKDGPGTATLLVTIEGTVTVASPSRDAPQLEVTIDGSLVPLERIDMSPQTTGERTVFPFRVQEKTPQAIKREGLERTWFPVARDKTMAVVLARASPGGRPTGWLGLV